MEYLLVYLIILILFLLSLRCSILNSISIPITLITLVLFVGLRYDSIDYFSYEDIYNQISNIGEISLYGYKTNNPGKIEPGFALLILLNKLIDFNFHEFIFLFSLLSITFKFIAFSKFSSFFTASLLIYVSDNLLYKDMSQIRSAMATGLILLAILYFSSKNTFKSLVALTTACSIHFFSFVGLLLFFTRFLNVTSLWMIFITAIIISIGGGASSLLFELIEIFNLDSIFSKVYVYKNTIYQSSTSFTSGTNLLQVFLTTFILIKYKSIINLNPYNKVLVSSYVVFSSLFLILIDFEILWGRVRDMYIAPIGAVLLTSFIVMYKSEVKRFFVTYAFILYTVVWFYLMIPHRNSYSSIINMVSK